jgi:hypothetical protein
VGYGKPPQHTRFKKGESGNPTGRPKGSKNLTTLLEKELKQRVVITENGRRRSITKQEAMVKHLVNKAVFGRPPADAAATRRDSSTRGTGSVESVGRKYR